MGCLPLQNTPSLIRVRCIKNHQEKTPDYSLRNKKRKERKRPAINKMDEALALWASDCAARNVALSDSITQKKENNLKHTVNATCSQS